MFDWQSRRRNTIDPVYRVVYLLQFLTMLVAFVGLFLVWWDSLARDQDAFDLLNTSFKALRERDPKIIGQPLVILWLLLPLIGFSAMRGFTGILVTPVSHRPVAWVTWGVAMLVLAHFLLNYGSELADDSPLKDGQIGIGFWVTGGAVSVLGVLLAVESLIREPEDSRARKPDLPAVETIEQLWEGDFQICPDCGALNDPRASRCYSCGNFLLDLDDV